MDIVKPVSMDIHQGIGKSGFTDHIEVIFSALTGNGGILMHDIDTVILLIEERNRKGSDSHVAQVL